MAVLQRIAFASTQKQLVQPMPVRTLLRRIVCGFATLLAAAGASHSVAGAQSARPVDRASIRSEYGKTPMSFEQNQGQTDKSVQFFARGSGYGLFLTSGDALLELERAQPERGKPAPTSSVLRMALAGSNAKFAVSAEQPLPGVVNYFRGSDAGKWVTDVETFGRVRYKDVYPGIDLMYYGNQRQLEYDFVVAPQANPKSIALNFSGASAKLDSAGNLVLADREVSTVFHKPVVYQMSGSNRISVDGQYRLHGQQVTFDVGAYDHNK